MAADREPTSYSELLLWVRKGPKGPQEILEEIATYGCGLNGQDQFCDTALVAAIRLFEQRKDRRYFHLVKHFIDEGADVNVTNQDTETPLHFLCNSDEYEDTAEDFAADVVLARELLDAGADLSARDMYGRTPLHSAVQGRWVQEIVMLLVERGADVNARDNAGDTPLHVHLAAAGLWHRNMIGSLLDLQADINAQNKKGNTPLLHAFISAKGDGSDDQFLVPLVELFLERGANPCVANKEGRTPLHQAAILKKTRTVELLIGHQQVEVNARDSDGNTPLHLAARNCEVKVIQCLLEHQADVTLENNKGDTPFQEAAWAQGAEVVEVMQLLISYGATPAVTNRKGKSPLHVLCWEQGHCDVLRFLLDRHLVDIHSGDSNGDTPLHVAAANLYPVCFEMVRLFLDYQADVNATNSAGDTPLHKACGLDCSDGAQRVKLKDQMVRLLVDHGAFVSIPNKFATTPLHIVVQKNESQMLQILLCDQTANVNVQDEDKDTPLSIAVKEEFVDCVRLLVERGANMNFADQIGTTPLVAACEKGNLDMIYHLIRFSPHHLRPQLLRPNYYALTEQPSLRRAADAHNDRNVRRKQC